MAIQLSVSQTIEASRLHCFNTAISIDARRLIQKHGPLPGIIDVTGHDAPWSAIGQQRRHTLSDNSSVNEELVVFTPGETFAYRVTDFTGPFAALVSEARGEWHFTTTSAEQCRLDWTYFFTPPGVISEPVLWFIVKLLWPGYLKSALTRVKEQAEL